MLYVCVLSRYLSPVVQMRRGAVIKFGNYVSQHLSGAGSSPAGSISRDLNSQKLHYQFSVPNTLLSRHYSTTTSRLLVVLSCNNI